MIDIEKCPLCEGKLEFAYDVPTKTGDSMSLSQCLSCESLVRNPFFDKEELNEIYASYPSHVRHYELPAGEKNNLVKRLDRIAKFAKKGGDFLEIGSGRGFLLQLAKERSWKVHGIEYEGSARENVIPEMRDEISFISDEKELGNLEAEKFDVVCSYQVFEHFTDPLNAFNAMFEALKPGGILLINTPNAGSRGARTHKGQWVYNTALEHFVIPSKIALKKLCVDRGMKIERIYYSGAPFFASKAIPEKPKNDSGEKQISAGIGKTYFSPGKIYRHPFLLSLIRTIVYALHLGDNIEIIARKK